jgi:hypothetical protein
VSNNPGAGAGDAPGGAGTDNAAQSQQPQTNQIPQNNNPDGQGEGKYDPVYAPKNVGGQGNNPIQLGAEASDAPIAQGEFAQNPTGQNSVPYNQVYTQYDNAAKRALQSDYIPLGLRDVVRDYFSSLEPGQKK